MRRTSPFTDPTWARASGNLAKIIAGDPEGKAQYEAALTDIKSTQQEDRFARENRGYMNNAADALMLGDPQGFVNNTVRTGNNWDDIADVLQASGGARMADGEINGDQMRAYMAGAGNAGDADTALTLDEQNQISGRNAAEDFRETMGKQRLANRSTLEGAVVQDMKPGSMNPAVIRDLSLALNADSVSPENVLAGAMQGGEMGIEEGVRIDDPLSADETIASALGDDMDALAYRRWGNGPEADRTAATLDGGSGGNRPDGYDTGDQENIAALKEKLTPAFANYMMDLGAPTVEGDDGPVLDYGSLPPDLVPAIEEMAAAAMQQDIDQQRGVRPASFYVTQAAKNLGVAVQSGEDEGFLYFDEPNSVTWNQNGQGKQQTPDLPVVNSNDDAAYAALPSGTTFVDENGKRYQKP